MSSLAEVVARLQREIAQSLHAAQSGSHGASAGPLQWTVERVSLQLNVALDLNAPEGQAVQVHSDDAAARAGSKPAGTHALSIEFLVRPGGAGSSRNELSAALPYPNGHAETEQLQHVQGDSAIVAELGSLLGPTGFDSSARAAVICDAIRELNREEGQAVAAALTKPVKEIQEQKIRQARHLIRGVVQSGPLKSQERAGSLLSGWFEQRSVAELVQLIETHWPTDRW